MEKNKKQFVVALAFITAVCLAGDSMLYIVLPTHWKEVGLSSLVEVGIILSINRFVRLPLNPLIGWIYSKLNFRIGILLAVILGGFTTLSYAFMDTLGGWMVTRSVWGLAWSLFKLGAFLLIIQMSNDSNRGNFMGTYNGLYRIGSLFGMLLGGFLADLFGIKLISLILGVLAFMTIPFIFKYIPLSLENNEMPSRKPNRVFSIHILKDSVLMWMLVTAFVTVMILEGMITATLSHIIDLQINSEMEVLGFIVGAASIGGALQALRWGITPFLSPKIGDILDNTNQKNYIIAVLLFLAAFLLVVIPLKLPLIIWLPLLLLHLLIASSATTVVDSVVSQHAAGLTNKIFIMTLYTIIVDLGAALGPILGYVLENKIGLTNLFWISSLLCLMLTIRWIFPTNKIPKRVKRVSNKPTMYG